MPRGPKKGETHSASFKKGVSGNPGGRPRAVMEVRELARSHTTTAIATLAEICGRDDMPAAARVSAANALLDRGYGRPEATTNVHINRSSKDMTYDELVAIASGAGAAGADDGSEITPGLH